MKEKIWGLAKMWWIIIGSVVMIGVILTVSLLTFFGVNGKVNFDFYEHEVSLVEYSNSYKISINDSIKDADMNVNSIENAYLEATTLSAVETEGHDSIEIFLQNSTVELSNTLDLSKIPVSGLPIVFTGSDDSVLSGGTAFSGGWTSASVGNGIYQRDVTGMSLEAFRQLYVEGDMAIRGRYPNENENFKKEVVDGKWKDDTKQLEVFSDLKGLTSDNGSLEVHFIEAWTSSIAKIKNIEEGKKSQILTFTDLNTEQFYTQRSTKIAEPKCWYENHLSLVDVANEWFYDEAKEMLYYKPADGVDINELEFTIPRLEQVIETNNVENISFRNIGFAYSNWNTPSERGFVARQAAYHMKEEGWEEGLWQFPTAGVSIVDSSNIEVSNSRIYNMGGMGITYSGKSNDGTVYYNDIHDIGAGGIGMGSFDPAYAQKNLVISDNVLEGMSRSYLGGVGILVGYADGLIVDHNDVTNVGYSGISVGWGWGEANKMANYKVTNNNLNDVMNNYLFDGSGLYTLGTFAGDETNLISGNFLDGGNGYSGLYFDEKSNHYDAKYNAVMKGDYGGWFLLMHDLDYGHQNINVSENYIETTSKKINSYDRESNGISPKVSLSDRNVVVENNYNKAYLSWQEKVNEILDNAGRRDK